MPNKKDIENIFQREFSLNKVTGKGLGLSHAKEIIEKSGGKIEVDSIFGEGTTITHLNSKYNC
ncbi:MAG: ATP-binding protein [Gammaproteobacteria bacterium]|jgi:signal transduction histidine kinase